MCYNTRMNNTSQSAFARLLATENIRIVHRRTAQTASFDIVKRVLTLPVWTNMNKSLYDMLIGHEVAHALWTPTEIDEERQCIKACSDIDPENPAAVMGILNIVEDARIERLIKDKYPGIKRDFVVGYKWLFDSGIFPIEEMGGVSKAGLPDRLNLHFKLGILGILNIPFSDEERTFVDRMSSSTTWEDVVEITRDLYEHQQSMTSSDTDLEVSPTEEGGDNPSDGNAPWTQDAIQQALGTESSKYETWEGVCSMPIANLDKIIVDIDTMETYFNDLWEHRSPGEIDAYKSNVERARQESRSRFDQWVNSEAKTVNYIVKQFEMKKAADEHKRSMIAKSGRLDPIKMMNYRWSEDIFARNTIVRDGKNHGFIFYLDWSGSMQNVLMQTVKQTILLAMFCQKAGIPMELVAFSDRGTKGQWLGDYDREATDLMWEREDAVVDNETKPCGYFQLLRFVRAGLNRRDLMDSLAFLWYCAEAESYRWGQDSFCNPLPPRLSLAATPLEEAITAAHVHVPQFQRRHGVQVMNVVILTDGDGNGGNYGTQIYNPINKVTYGYHPEHKEQDPSHSCLPVSTQLVRSLRETTGANVIGMYLHGGSSPKTAHGWFPQEDDPDHYYRYDDGHRDRASAALKDHTRNWKKNNFIIATGRKACTYTEAYIINGNVDPDNDLEIDDTNHAKMRSSFVKGMAQRSMSRILTNRFVDRIAC